jgi:hypothetical protein
VKPDQDNMGEDNKYQVVDIERWFAMAIERESMEGSGMLSKVQKGCSIF